MRSKSIPWSRIDEMLARQDFLYQRTPTCRHCGNEQVQIMSKAAPARWRCRICRYIFVYEPPAGEPPPEKPPLTFEIHPGPPPKIECRKCGAVSSHPKDVENVYCARCHHFHERR